ncbi:hypothetical protein D3C79_624370 [compost metagenome]
MKQRRLRHHALCVVGHHLGKQLAGTAQCITQRRQHLPNGFPLFGDNARIGGDAVQRQNARQAFYGIHISGIEIKLHYGLLNLLWANSNSHHSRTKNS